MRLALPLEITSELRGGGKVSKEIPKNRLRELRENRQLTQEEVGKVVGYDYTTVSKHETSARALDNEAISRYKKLYKVESHELFFSLNELIGEEIDNAPEYLAGECS